MKKKKTGNSVFKILLLGLNYAIAALLLLSYLAPYINPEKVWLLAFLGLAYPILLILNMLFIFIWLIRFDKSFLLSLICILAGWNYPGRFYQVKAKPFENSEENYFKVSSYNVHYFGRYNPRESDNFEKEAILEYVMEEDADILCFQEFFLEKDADSFFELMQKNGIAYHKAFLPYVANQKFSGMLILSRFPIIRTAEIVSDSTRSRLFGMTADILLETDTVRIYNLHLQSIKLSDEEFVFDRIPEIADKHNNNKLKVDSKRLISKLKISFIKRAAQAKIVSDHIKSCPYPIIVCGDFNDTPLSFAYYQIKNELKDAFVLSGKGTGQTYAGNYPSFRIDYLLHSNHFKSQGFSTGTITASDHYPVAAYLKLNKKENE
jgi:endonuclease/exonuclease/phosphatase family metal-dependent hydrolase